MYRVSVGVMAYNEERNIGKLLEALTSQLVSNDVISEIIVVSSGSTDRTDEIVSEWCERDERIALIRQFTQCLDLVFALLVVPAIFIRVAVVFRFDAETRQQGIRTVQHVVEQLQQFAVGMVMDVFDQVVEFIFFWLIGA